ncbi:hypothetical protein BG004_006342 [Podila humilis]|nr:hypothetical protein BG004_006342 [Podila humilis]
MSRQEGPGKIPVLIWVTKTQNVDSNDCDEKARLKTTEHVSRLLEVDKIRENVFEIRVQVCDLNTGEGVADGLEWIVGAVEMMLRTTGD